MTPPTKHLDPDLARFCQDLADVAGACAGATNAVLIDANAVKLTLGGIGRGGAVLVIRFPAAAVTRDEAPLQELLGPTQPKPTCHIHVQAAPAPEGPDLSPGGGVSAGSGA